MAGLVLSVRGFPFSLIYYELNVPRNRLLIPLNVCRRDNLYVPWECETERHAYEEYVPFQTSRAIYSNNEVGHHRCQYKE